MGNLLKSVLLFLFATLLVIPVLARPNIFYFFLLQLRSVETSGRLDCRCRPLPGPESDSEVKTDESKGVPASCGLGLRRTWNSAWKSLCKFVAPKLFKGINAIKNRTKTHTRRMRSIYIFVLKELQFYGRKKSYKIPTRTKIPDSTLRSPVLYH
jgi:hypothetical protein